MEYLRDKYDRLVNGNGGEVKIWYMKHAYGYAHCRALVREDGKILSSIDCYDQEHMDGSQTFHKVIQTENGRYLEEKKYNKMYEL